MRRPKNFKLSDKFSLQSAHKGQPLFYLKTDPATHHWIEGRGKVKRLIKWLQKIEKLQEHR